MTRTNIFSLLALDWAIMFRRKTTNNSSSLSSIAMETNAFTMSSTPSSLKVVCHSPISLESHQVQAHHSLTRWSHRAARLHNEPHLKVSFFNRAAMVMGHCLLHHELCHHKPPSSKCHHLSMCQWNHIHWRIALIRRKKAHRSKITAVNQSVPTLHIPCIARPRMNPATVVTAVMSKAIHVSFSLRTFELKNDFVSSRLLQTESTEQSLSSTKVQHAQTTNG